MNKTEARREYQRNYQREYQKKRWHSLSPEERRAVSQARIATPAWQAYQARPDVRAKQAAYQKEYNQRPEVIARRRLRERARYHMKVHGRIPARDIQIMSVFDLPDATFSPNPP